MMARTPSRCTPIGVVAMLLLLTLSPAGAQSGVLRGLDAYVEQGMRDWEIPGLAMAVVRGDSILHIRGYGVRELGSAAPVDGNTVFAIGSASKAFTAATVAMLVDEGAVAWDDPASDYLPELQLFDPWATRQLTVRDLLTHRSGLSRGDRVWYGTGFGRDEILRRVRYLEPSWGFRAQFGYQNLMYLAAGEVVAAVTGRDWDAFLEDRIFEPLGMDRTVSSTIPLDRMRNVASPHSRIDDELRPVPYRNIDNIAPAGSINSSARDMTRWIRLQLGSGAFEGERLLSEDVVEEMHTPQMLVRREGGWAAMSPRSHFMAYGLGWFLNDHRGRKVVQHGGNIDGMHALVGFMPEEDVGLVILTNLNPNQLTYALMYRVFDAILGAEPVDYSAELLARADSLEALAEEREREREAERVTGTSPSRDLEHYAGTYEHPMYGRVEVEVSGGGLRAEYGPNTSTAVEHWHFDTFRIQWDDPMLGESLVNFRLDASGAVEAMEVQGLGTFERVPEPGQ